MSKFAEIVVNSYVSNNEDMSVFDYVVPERFIDIVKSGMRVIVPFGHNRILEGYIIDVKETTNIPHNKIKPIHDIPDSSEVFNSKQMMLAKWISKEYMCSLIDVLKCILPPEMVLREKKMLVLGEVDEMLLIKLNDNQKEIINAVRKQGGKIAYDLLKKCVSDNVFKSLKSVVKSGLLHYESTMNSNTKEKIARGLQLNAVMSEVDNFIEAFNNDKRYRSQADVLKALKNYDDIVIEKEFTETFGFSKSTVDALVKKGIVKRTEVRVQRDPYLSTLFPKAKRPVLTSFQKDIIDKIIRGYNTSCTRNYLIHGVTGSGKTEIYMQLIEYVINMGKQAIMLVPEISLTPQTIERFKGRFDSVAVIHSKLSAGERYDEWQRIKEGKADVVVGARSAVFAPLENVGIIILDEEHENSYKSDKTPKYHTREVARKRCEIEDAIFILGSATPNIETYYEATKGKYTICTIKQRVDDKKMPCIELVDMRQEIISGNRTIFSKKLYEEINTALRSKNQIILFLNRRGFSTFVSCRECGLVLKCPHCDVSLTYHMDRNILNCHYCDYTIKSPDLCPSCKSRYIKYFGIGTQKVESEVKKSFPDARVLRMDMDTTSRKGSHDRIYNAFKNRDADILIGTQMVSKGLDFPGVALVGIIAADMTLNIPDFRSCERSFQLITQVAGRAGRGDTEGRVIVQTYDPLHYCIQSALNHDYNGFYEKEILIRKSFNYPPYCDLINIIVSSKTEYKVIEAIKKLTSEVSRKLACKDNYIVLGPSPAPISKINTYHRWQTIIKGKADTFFKDEISALIGNISSCYEDVKVYLDINPVSML